MGTAALYHLLILFDQFVAVDITTPLVASVKFSEFVFQYTREQF
jgi:hypothetical protein